jgi:hypothetical protein
MNERLVFPELEKRRSSAEEQVRWRGRAWWWVTQLGTLFGTAPMVAWLHWQTRLRLPPGLRDLVFWVNVTAVALHWCTRFAILHGLFGGLAEVEKQAVRITPWIMRTGWLVVAGIAADAILVGYWSGDPVFTAILGALAMAGVAALAFIEPAAARAAFSGLSTEEPAHHTPSRFAHLGDPRFVRIALSHVPFALLLVAPVAIGRVSLEEVFQGFSAQMSRHQILLAAYSLVMVAGGATLVSSTVTILKEGFSGVRIFRRWFGVFFAIDLVAIGAWIFVAFTGNEGRHTPAFVSIIVAITLVALPFGQLHMAKQLAGDAVDSVAASQR